MKHFSLPITSKIVLGFNHPIVTTYIHVLLTCTYSVIVLVRVVFHKTYTVEEGIRQGLLRHNLALINILQQIKRRFSVFLYQQYIVTSRKDNFTK